MIENKLHRGESEFLRGLSYTVRQLTPQSSFMRVNARLDETTQQQLLYLTEATGQSVSHVVRESVAQYYGQMKRKRVPSGFLALAGTGDSGLTDLSVNAKAYFAQAMEKKYPQHMGVDPKAASEGTAKTAAKTTAKKPKAGR
jgi:hypothetical protein